MYHCLLIFRQRSPQATHVSCPIVFYLPIYLLFAALADKYPAVSHLGAVMVSLLIVKGCIAPHAISVGVPVLDIHHPLRCIKLGFGRYHRH